MITDDALVQQPLDRFTAGHAAVGFVYGLAGLPWWTALGLAITWELAENALKDFRPDWFPRPIPDSLPNATLDTLALMAGWAVARALPADPLSGYFSDLRRRGVSDPYSEYQAELARRGL